LQLSRDLQEAIRKSLPGEYATALKEILEEKEEQVKTIERQKESLDAKESLISTLRKEIEKQTEKIAELENRVVTHGHLKDLKRDIEKRERDLEIVVLKTKLDAAEQTNVVVQGLVSTIFRNNTVKKTAISQVPVVQTSYEQIYDNNTNQYISNANGNYVSYEKSETVTTEEAE
jgi:predicted nuclease with TOPRIM domain